MSSPVHPRPSAADSSEDGRPTLSRRLGKTLPSERPATRNPRTALPPHLLVTNTLGEGGTATVYEAFHRRLKIRVAVKVPKPSSIDAAELHVRLVREAELCARLGSSRVPHIYDVDTMLDGTPYVVMDLIRGRCVDDLLSQGPLEVDTACAIICDLLTAVGELHGAGIVHRDIKPSNLMLEDTADGSLRVRVLDLGIASWLPGTRQAAEKRLTQGGMFVGTPGYMAHEQLLGKEVDHRADIYAVGAVFYEMLAGEAAFAGDSANQVIAAALRDEPRPLTHAPQGLIKIVSRAMAKSADARFSSADEMKKAIQNFQSSAQSLRAILGEGETVQALHSYPPYPVVKRRPSRAWSWVAAAGCVFGTVAMTWPEQPKAESAPAASRIEVTSAATERPLTEPPRLVLEAPSLVASPEAALTEGEEPDSEEQDSSLEEQDEPAEETLTRRDVQRHRPRQRAQRREATAAASVEAPFIEANPYSVKPVQPKEVTLPANPYAPH